MVAIVSGNSLGLELTSLRTLGPQGVAGNAAHGRSGEAVYVNAANGNLVLQDRDDVLVARGPDAEVLRTYNSLGLFNDDNGDNWTDGVAPLPLALSGSLNTAGSTITRTDRDGSAAVYSWDAANGRYFTTEGDGAYDTLRYVAADNQFEWMDGPTGATERYAASGPMRMLLRRDAAGDAMSFTYDAAGRLASSTTANGDVTTYDRTGANLTQVRTVTAQGVTSILVHYGYDGSNRLATVTVDLGSGNSYTTTYTYETGSNRVSVVQQSDGTRLTFSYLSVAGAYRVLTVSDATGTTTTFGYDAVGHLATSTTAGLVTRFTVDGAGRLTGIIPPGNGAPASLTVVYDSDGNATSVTDGASRTTTYGYDRGNRIAERNVATGMAVDRRFDSFNQLLWESQYTGTDPDGLGPAQAGGALATRSVYEAGGRHLLRFTVSAEGRVVEYRYGGPGDRPTATLAYATAYAVPANLPWDGLTLDTMLSWAASQQSAVAQRTDATYNARGQLQTRTTTTSGVAGSLSSVEQFVYDQRGLLLQRIAPSRGTTTYTYDGLGRELTCLDAAGRLTVTQYADATRKTTVTTANGLVTTSTWDAAGRLVASLQTNAASVALGQTTYVYDAAGRRRMSTDPAGVHHWWLWDDAGRCVGEVDGNGTLTETSYDGSGLAQSKTTYGSAVNLALLVDGSGNAVTSATVAAIRPAATANDVAEWRMYDGAGRLVRVATTVGSGANAAVTDTVYDAASRLVAQTSYAAPIAITDISAGSIPLPAANAQDRTTRNFYDNDSRLIGTLDAEGYVVKLSYDAAGRQTERLAYATATNAALRASGTFDQLLPAANAADQKAVTFYDAGGHVVAQVDAEGYMTETAYDPDGNPVRSVRYATRVSAPYSSASALASFRPQSASADQVTTRVFDPMGRQIQETGPDGVTTISTYDTAGNLVSTTRAVGTAEERSVLARYDVQGRKTAELTAEGAALLAGQSQAGIDAIWAQYGVAHAYDSAGRRISTSDSVGHKTFYFYNEDGALVFTVNALGEIQESRYDVLGRVTARIARATRVSVAGLIGGLVTPFLQSFLSPSSASDSTETFTYTRDGQLASRTDASGGTTTYTTNLFGDRVGSTQAIDNTSSLVTAFTVDRRGLQTSVAKAPASLNLVTTTNYDAFGRQVRITDPTGAVTTRTYDRLGRTVTVTDPLNAVRTTTFDAFDRVLTQADALGAVTSYTYDAGTRTMRVTTPEGYVTTTVSNRNGQVQSVTDPKGQTTSYAYDRNGRLTKTTTPLTTLTGPDSTYDAAGRLVTSTDANGKSVAYTYDTADRVLTRTVDPGGLALVTSWAYDAKGQAVTVTDPNGIATTFSYDLAGRILTQTVDQAGLNLQTVYAYDKRGKTLTVTAPQGTVTAYTYDVAGRRTMEVINPAAPLVTRSWIYDGQDRVLAAVDGAGQLTRYAYDAAGRLVFTVDPTGSVQKQAYDAAGRVTRSTTFASAISLGGLASVASVGDIQARVMPQPQDEVEQRVYDRDGRLLATVDGTGAVVRFAYDGNGNVVSRTAYAQRIDLSTWQAGTVPQPQADPAHDQQSRFVYDALDRLQFSVDAAGAVVEQAYDGNGNVVRRTAYARTVTLAGSLTSSAVTAALVLDSAHDRTVRNTYDAANRLAWTADGTGAVARFDYDKNGNMVRKTEFATAITAADPPSTLPQATTSDRVTTQYYDAANRLVFVVDALNSVRETIYDRNGRVIRQVAYAKLAASVPSPTAPGVLSQVRPLVDSNADRATRYGWDAAGRVTVQMDADGAFTKTQYDGAGRPVVTTAIAMKLSWPAYAANAVTSLVNLVLTDATVDRTTKRSYDGAGRLLYEVGGMGEVTGYQYDGAGRLLRKTRFATPLPAGASPSSVTADVTADRVETFTYDAAGHQLTSTDSSGTAETFTYDALGAKLTFTNRKGAQWRYDHDAMGRVVEEMSPQVDLTTTDIDANGNVAATVTTNAAVVTRFGYDAFGNLAMRTEAAGRREERTTRYEYDALGRQVHVVHPQVGTYDAAHDNLVTNGLAGRVETNAVPETWTYYDALGNAVAGRDAGNALSQKVYDRMGRVEFGIDARGQLTQYTRNAFGEVTALTRYATSTTLANRAVTSAAQATTRAQVLAARQVSMTDRTVDTTYDRNGRVTKVQEPAAVTFDAGTNAISSAIRATTSTSYNAFGEAIQVTRQGIVASSGTASGPGAVTMHYFDRSGQEVATVDAMGYVTQRTFDARGNLTESLERAVASSSWDSTGYGAPPASADDRRTTFTYDRLDRKTSETRWDVEYSAASNGSSTRGNLVTTFGYDAVGNLTRTTDAAGGSTYTAYDALGRTRAVAAPARPNASGNGLLTPLTTFARDAHGQVVVQTEWAAGAQVANETSIQAAGPGSEDRITRTFYDSFGRATASTDAQGATAYTSHDAWGHVAKTWRGVKDIDGLVRTVFQVSAYDAIGQLVGVVDPAPATLAGGGGTVTTALEYDAFGELTRKGTGGERQEYFDYDGAGRLWRTNTGDGIDRIRLFDAWGNVTSEITSAGSGGSNVSLLALAKAEDALLDPNVRRTDTTYDLLGRVRSKLLPSRTEGGSNVGVLRGYVGVAITESATPLFDGSNNVVGTSGTNRVTLTWSGISQLGPGDVKVEMKYYSGPPDGRYAPVVRTWSSSVLDAAAASTTATWTESPYDMNGGITRVLQVTVRKKDVNGNWVVVLDQAPGYGNNFIAVDAPADHTTQVVLQIRTAGSAGETGWWNATALVDFGDKLRFDTAGLSVGGYEYRVKLVTQAGEVRTVDSGTVSVDKPLLQAITSAVSYWAPIPGVLAWLAPGASVAQVFRYRLVGSTGAWSSLDVKPYNGGARDGVDTSAVPVAGTYQFELLWTPAGAGVPTSHATGTFTVVAAVPPQWVPPVNLPPIYNPRLAYGPGGRLDLVWDAALATRVLFRPAGGTWTNLSVDNWGQMIDEYGQPSGQQGAVLGYLSAGTYEVQVLTGSPATRQATATITVYPTSPGYWTTQWQYSWTYVPVTDEYGNTTYEVLATLVPVSVWVPGTTPAPSITVTTPPYVPGYMSSGSPAQYSVAVNASPGNQAISGTDGATLSQSIAAAEAAHNVRPLVQQKTDRWGNVVETTDPRWSDWKTSYRYNASNQLLRETHAGGSAGTAATDLFYDKLGRQVATRDARGNVNGQEFDAAGNLVREVHADGGVVTYAYDAFGNRVKSVDALGHAVAFTYDRLGRQLSRVQGPVYVYGVTGANALTDKVLRTLTDSWTYDELGRKLTQKNGNDETLSYRYDLRGNLVETRQPLGQSVRAAFDAQGRKLAEVDATGAQATWSYDYFGRLTGHTDLGGESFAYVYDQARQLVQQTSTRGQSLTFGYDAAGQQTTITDNALGKVTTYVYDLGGRKLRERVVQAGTTYQDNHLSYDGLGNLRDVADARVHLAMTYDLVGNRTRITTSVNYQGVSGEVTAPSDRWFVYDSMNRQTAVDAIDAAGTRGQQGHTIAYDAAGNRTSDTWWGNRVIVGSGLQYIATYDENMNAVYGLAPTTTYTTTVGDTTEVYGYDAANRLRVVTRDGVAIDERLYDGAGRVVRSGPGTLPTGHAAALNQGVAASQAIGNETRINRYDANGRLLHQKILSSDGTAKSDISWDAGETFSVLGTVTHAAGYDAAGNVLGYVVHTPLGNPILSTYTNTLRKFDGYVADSTSASGPGAVPGTVTQQYDANGLLVGVLDPTRSDGNRTFVNDSAGHTLFVSQGGKVQRQLVVDGEVLGIYGVGADPVPGNSAFANIVDFDFGYSKITGNYPSAAPGAYQVRPGDTLQSIAQAAYGDGKLWYRIADANGIASNAALKVGQTVNIPTGVGTISNDRGTFKPYDASRMVGDTSPVLMPVPGSSGECGAAGKVLMVVVAVVVTIQTGVPDSTFAKFWATFFEASPGAASIATAATAAAAGSVASQSVAMISGNADSLNWSSVALSAISAGVTQGLGGPKPVIADLVVRATIANALTQGVGVVTGSQKRFDWRGVSGSAMGMAIGRFVGSELGLAEDGARGAMESGEFLAKSALKNFAATLATAAARSGRIAVTQVAIDTFGNAGAQAVSMDRPVDSVASSSDDPLGDLIQKHNGWADKSVTAAPPAADFAGETARRRAVLAAGFDPDASQVDSLRRNGLYLPGVNDAVTVLTSELGGHYSKPQIIGQAFVGGYSPTLKRVFTQDDLNLLIAHSQFPDQLKDLDGTAAGIRFFTGDSENKGSEVPRMIQRAIHSLNYLGAQANKARVFDLLAGNPGDLALAGQLLHPYEDSDPHDGFGSAIGHLLQSLGGRSPDPVTPQSLMRSAPDTIRFFEKVLGISADSVMAGQEKSIRVTATSTLEAAIELASVDASEEVPFEHRFNAVASNVLPSDALRLPSLQHLTDRLGSTPQEALETTDSYLRAIRLNASSARFLSKALDSAALIVNHYMEFTWSRPIPAIDARNLLRSQTPDSSRPDLSNPIYY